MTPTDDKPFYSDDKPLYEPFFMSFPCVVAGQIVSIRLALRNIESVRSASTEAYGVACQPRAKLDAKRLISQNTLSEATMVSGERFGIFITPKALTVIFGQLGRMEYDEAFDTLALVWKRVAAWRNEEPLREKVAQRKLVRLAK